MKSSKMLGFLTFFILFCVQCKDDVPQASTSEKPYIQIINPFDLVGTWEWTGSGGGGINGNYTSQEDAGYEAHLLLYPNRTYERYVDYEVRSNGVYHYEIDSVPHNSANYILYFDGDEGRIVQFNDSKLEVCLGTQWNAGSSSYIRLTE